MREYIHDMLDGLSQMARDAKMHDLSVLLKIAVREAGGDRGRLSDETALKTALNE